MKMSRFTALLGILVLVACGNELQDNKEESSSTTEMSKAGISIIQTVKTVTDFKGYLGGGMAGFTNLNVGSMFPMTGGMGWQGSTGSGLMSAGPGQARHALFAAGEDGYTCNEQNVCYKCEGNICTVKITHEFAAGELVKLVEILVVDTKGDWDDSNNEILSYSQEKDYRDGSSGAVTTEDLDEPPDGKLGEGKLRVKEIRAWPDGSANPEDLSELDTIIDLLVNATDDSSDDVAIGLSLVKYYRDGSVGNVTTEDLDEDGNLGAGILRWTEVRDFVNATENPDNLKTATSSVDVILNGPGETDDLVASAHFTAENLEGITINVDVNPDQPIPPGADVKQGTISVVMVFPENFPIDTASRFLDMDVCEGDKACGTLTDRVIYRNGGGEDVQTVNFLGNTGTVEGSSRDGVTYEGSFNNDTGEWELTSHMPSQSDVDYIVEKGQFTWTAERRGSGTYTREVHFRAGAVNTTWADVTVNGPVTVIKATESSGANGTITIKETPLFTTVKAEWTTEQGIEIKWMGRRFANGYATLHALWDNPQTPRDPDAEAHYYFNPDGSGHGTVTYHMPDGSDRTYTVIFFSDGSGRAEDEEGNAEVF